MTRPWRLRALRWSFAAFIGYASAETYLAPGHGGFAGLAIRVLAAAEFLAAALFATELYETAACAALLAIFSIAAVLTYLGGEWPFRFLYFAATAVFLTMERDKGSSNTRSRKLEA